MAQITFDASSVAPEAPRELLPPDRYPVQIVQSEMRATKAGDGQMLWIEMDIIDGAYRGRKIWDQLNLVNRSEIAQEIAQRRLSAICHAVGQVQVTDSQQLHFKPMLCTLKVEPAGIDRRTGQHKDTHNKITGYQPMAGTTITPRPPAQMAPARPTTPAPAPAPVQPPRPAAAAPATPPWRRQG